MKFPSTGRIQSGLTVGILAFLACPPSQAREIYWAETNSDAVFGASVVDGADQRKIRDLDETGRGSRSYFINEIAVFDNLLFITAPGDDRIFYTTTTTPNLSGLFVNLDREFNTNQNIDYRPVGITANSEHVYWTDSNTRKIYRADFGIALGGRGAEELIDLPGDDPRPQSITVFGNDLYWVLEGRDEIYRSDLEGNNVSRIISLDSTFGDGSYIPNAITATDRHIYWSDIETDTIYRADRDGSNAIPLIDTGDDPSDGPVGLTTDGLFLYWTTFLDNDIFAATLDGQLESSERFTPDPDPNETGPDFSINTLAIAYVPEPASLTLLITAAAVLSLRRRRDESCDD
ncbi:MAG: PEP-CTERM sorting domain-containing protein [Planctomycetota bacterium]